MRVSKQKYALQVDARCKEGVGLNTVAVVAWCTGAAVADAARRGQRRRRSAADRVDADGVRPVVRGRRGGHGPAAGGGRAAAAGRVGRQRGQRVVAGGRTARSRPAGQLGHRGRWRDVGGRRTAAAEERRSPASPPPPFDAAYDRPSLLPAKSAAAKQLPVLPNRNAVYVADAILPQPVGGSRGDDELYRGNGARTTDDDSDGRDDDLEVVLPASSPRETQMEMEFMDDDDDDKDVDRGVHAKMDTFAQEQATDLSLPKRNGGGGGGKASPGYGAGAADYFSTGGSSGSEAGSGSRSPMMPAPPPPHGVVAPAAAAAPHNFLLNPSAAAIAAAGLFSPPSPSFSPFYHQRALQLHAAMSRAATLGLPFHRKDVAPVAASKPAVRSAHGYVPAAFGNSASNVYTGKCRQFSVLARSVL